MAFFFLSAGLGSVTSGPGIFDMFLSNDAFMSYADFVKVLSRPLKVSQFCTIWLKSAMNASTVEYLLSFRFSSRVLKSIGFVMILG